MKFVVTCFFLTVIAFAYSQDETIMPDSLAVVQLDYQVMDAAQAQKLSNIVKIDTCTFFGSNDILGKVAYCLHNDKSHWYVFSFFVDLDGDIDGVKGIEEAHKISGGVGDSALVVKATLSNYGTGGGTGVHWVKIIKLDTVPVQVFKIKYGCWDESFGDRDNNGEGSYFDEFKLDIRVLKNGLLISGQNGEGVIDSQKGGVDFQNSEGMSLDQCQTSIAAGTYIITHNGMKKKN